MTFRIQKKGLNNVDLTYCSISEKYISDEKMDFENEGILLLPTLFRIIINYFK
jgi:hypothetical protein